MHLLPQDLLTRLQWRYAVKSFESTKKIPTATWDALETALQLTPSSYGLQPWKFMVIQDSELREKLRAVSFNQRQVTECSHFVVFTHHPEMTEADIDRFLDAFASARKIPRPSLDGYRKVIVGDVMGPRKPFVPEWTARQSYIALGSFMTAAALMGVDTCPMEGFDSKKYDEILGLNETRFRTVVACAAGYRSPEDKSSAAAKVRYPKKDIIERR
ncbi:MAG TPA: NAD(P)H-dependent oxidoreductase [Bdellovibrionota bacterium]|jgi:nitroreductase